MFKLINLVCTLLTTGDKRSYAHRFRIQIIRVFVLFLDVNFFVRVRFIYLPFKHEPSSGSQLFSSPLPKQ